MKPLHAPFMIIRFLVALREHATIYQGLRPTTSDSTTRDETTAARNELVQHPESRRHLKRPLQDEKLCRDLARTAEARGVRVIQAKAQVAHDVRGGTNEVVQRYGKPEVLEVSGAMGATFEVGLCAREEAFNRRIGTTTRGLSPIRPASSSLFSCLSSSVVMACSAQPGEDRFVPAVASLPMPPLPPPPAPASQMLCVSCGNGPLNMPNAHCSSHMLTTEPGNLQRCPERVDSVCAGSLDALETRSIVGDRWSTGSKDREKHSSTVLDRVRDKGRGASPIDATEQVHSL